MTNKNMFAVALSRQNWYTRVLTNNYSPLNYYLLIRNNGN